MRTFNAQQVSRPESYDRNPVIAAANYQNTFAPHVETVRNTYTVPAGKKAKIEGVLATTLRATVAAPVGVASTFIYIDPVALNPMVMGVSMLATNNVGDHEVFGTASGGILLAGDQIYISTSDTSTGGTVTYRGTALLTVFDA